MNIFLLPYKKGSAGSRLLSEALGIRRIKLEKSRFQPTANKVILNWGNTTAEVNRSGTSTWINPPEAVANAIDKIKCLRQLRAANVPCVDMVHESEYAAEWLTAGDAVVARTKVSGSGGEGIFIIEGNTELSWDDNYKRLRQFMREQREQTGDRVQFFTKYFKAKDEYRVHVFDNNVIDIQQKRKRSDAEEVNFMVRNHDNGFVFCRENVELPAGCAEIAVNAVNALGLDFGAVDLRYNAKQKRCAVLEVNTAPGLEGTTLEIYVNAVRELIEQIGV